MIPANHPPQNNQQSFNNQPPNHPQFNQPDFNTFGPQNVPGNRDNLPSGHPDLTFPNQIPFSDNQPSRFSPENGNFVTQNLPSFQGLDNNNGMPARADTIGANIPVFLGTAQANTAPNAANVQLGVFNPQQQQPQQQQPQQQQTGNGPLIQSDRQQRFQEDSFQVTPDVFGQTFQPQQQPPNPNGNINIPATANGAVQDSNNGPFVNQAPPSNFFPPQNNNNDQPLLGSFGARQQDLNGFAHAQQPNGNAVSFPSTNHNGAGFPGQNDGKPPSQNLPTSIDITRIQEQNQKIHDFINNQQNSNQNPPFSGNTNNQPPQQSGLGLIPTENLNRPSSNNNRPFDPPSVLPSLPVANSGFIPNNGQSESNENLSSPQANFNGPPMQPQLPQPQQPMFNPTSSPNFIAPPVPNFNDAPRPGNNNNNMNNNFENQVPNFNGPQNANAQPGNGPVNDNDFQARVQNSPPLSPALLPNLNNGTGKTQFEERQGAFGGSFGGGGNSQPSFGGQLQPSYGGAGGNGQNNQYSVQNQQAGSYTPPQQNQNQNQIPYQNSNNQQPVQRPVISGNSGYFAPTQQGGGGASYNAESTGGNQQSNVYGGNGGGAGGGGGGGVGYQNANGGGQQGYNQQNNGQFTQVRTWFQWKLPRWVAGTTGHTKATTPKQPIASCVTFISNSQVFHCT